MTSLAVGSAVSAPIAGRLVARIGRPLVVLGVTLFSIGAAWITIVVAAAPALTDPGTIILRLAFPLFLIGVGGGAVITPNQTLSLADVDRRIGGSAGGVLQTAQRVGAAIGQAAIGAVFFAVVAGSVPSTGPGSPAQHPQDFSAAIVAALAAAIVFSLAALVLGLLDLRSTRRRRFAAAPLG